MDLRKTRSVPSALILLTLAGCGVGHAATPAPSTSAAADVRVRDVEPGTLALEGDDPAGLSVAASRLVFDAAPVVVVAAAGDDTALPALSAAAVALRAPALLVPDAGAEVLAREAERLGARAAVVVQDAPAEIEVRDATAPSAGPGADLAERAARDAGLEVVRLDPDDVGHGGGGSAAARDAEPVLHPDDLADLRDELGLAGDEPPLLTEVLVLTDPEPGQEAAVATLQAAGAVPFAVPGGDLAADGDALRRVDEAHALTVVGVGRRFADADRLAWQVRAAETGALLPTGSQRALPARYVATTAVRGQDPGRAVERAAAAAGAAAETPTAEAPTSEGATADGPVVPTVVVEAVTRQVSAGPDGDHVRAVPVADLEPVVDAARAAGQQVLLEVEGGGVRLDDQLRGIEPLLRRAGVGVVLHPEQRRSGAGLDRGGSVPVGELQAAVDYLANVVTDADLPQTLLVVHDLDDAVGGADALVPRPQVAVLDADALEGAR
ncbi:hypothetical protein [Puerhibacterium sp. TATVAM-FAB25]|uniref:hypothetical protein n=1 Tax=Puerhibacterium sp. TATVAM-FAB25 TaxID=3093699 RepID=UPI0039782CA7